jgi:D-alanyl-D-alanine carboxypeptidase (penicillin-binding protein 5/6)
MRWWCGGLVLLVLAGGVPAWGVAPGPLSTILVEAGSGEVLAENHADLSLNPGNLAQLMVLLLGLERSEVDKMPLDVPVTIGPDAVAGAALQRSRGLIPLRADRAYLLSDLMRATLVSAAESAALAVAEVIAGSIPLCVEAMNQRAALLGLSTTRFNGLGGVRVEAGEDRSTARDLSKLARALIGHPQVLAWSSLTGLPFDRGTVFLRNTNSMVGTVRGVDGLHASMHAGQFGLIVTAQRGALRLIAVVLNAADSNSAYRAASDLLEQGFADVERIEVVRARERLKVSVNVEGGAVTSIVPVASDSFSVLRRGSEERRLTLRYQLPEVVFAPLREGDRVGELIIEEQGELVAVIPVLSPSDVARAGLLSVAAR